MLLDPKISISTLWSGNGYISGVVTIANKKTSRLVLCIDAHTLQTVAQHRSLANGHYLIPHLNTSFQYLIMCRDLPPNGKDQRYEPVCWDYVTPATDLTIAEQQELWQSWQSE